MALWVCVGEGQMWETLCVHGEGVFILWLWTRWEGGLDSQAPQGRGDRKWFCGQGLRIWGLGNS